MICNFCNKEIHIGERAIEISYGNVYKTVSTLDSLLNKKLEIVGDHSEYFHIKCFEKRKSDIKEKETEYFRFIEKEIKIKNIIIDIQKDLDTNGYQFTNSKVQDFINYLNKI